MVPLTDALVRRASGPADSSGSDYFVSFVVRIMPSGTWKYP